MPLGRSRKTRWDWNLMGHISFWLMLMIWHNIDTIKENTETLIDASKEVGLEINIEKSKYMLLSHHQNLGQNRDTKIGDRFFENVSQFKYMDTTVADQNLIQGEIKRRLNSGNACYHSRLLSENLKIRTYKTIILPVVLYRCETWIWLKAGWCEGRAEKTA
jgi:hypothetical protein